MASRVRTAQVRIPRQRGHRSVSAHVVDFGRGTQPVVVVVPRRPSLAGRLALALGASLWRGRAEWAPVWGSTGVLTVSAVLSATVPAVGIVVAVPAVLLPVAWAVARRWHPRPAVRRQVRALRTRVFAVSGALAWCATAVLVGPVNWPMFALWLVGTTAAQAVWWRARRALASKPIQP